MVTTIRINAWALGTTVTGPVGQPAIEEAGRQMRAYAEQRASAATSPVQVWMLDASGATDVSMDVLPAIKGQVDVLRTIGMDRIALVLPPAARGYVDFVKASLHEQIHVFPFDSAEAAITWINGGCR